ncbi:MAG: VanZ family protein [Pirellulales bacterium]|nr:VanZ family protein [Pirellulales bacterium]
MLPPLAVSSPDYDSAERATRIFGLPRGGLSATAARRWALVLLGLYVALLFTSTHWPQLRLPAVPTVIPPDKIAHFCCYAGLAALALLLPVGFLRRPDGSTARRRLAAAVALWLLVIATGVVDEWTQPWFERDFEWADLACDASGSLLAIVVVSAIRNRRHRGD